jgi:LPXTG-motif cell wall-anchored protein
VAAGTYDLEARLAGTETVALSVPGVALEDGNVYTIFAMGLAGGEPALTAVPSLDAAAPVLMPVTGGETTNLWLMALLAGGLALVAGGLFLRRRENHIVAR